MAVLHDWRICPRCGSALDRSDAPVRVSCPNCGFVGFANPKPTASAFVVDNAGRLLLARRAIEPFLGCWDTPGGFVEEGEHPLDALRRELREETSLEVEPGRFVGVWMDEYGPDPDAQSTLNLYWEASVLSGEPRPADDVAELAWFDPDDLPPRSEFAFTALADAIDGWLSSRNGP